MLTLIFLPIITAVITSQPGAQINGDHEQVRSTAGFRLLRKSAGWKRSRKASWRVSLLPSPRITGGASVSAPLWSNPASQRTGGGGKCSARQCGLTWEWVCHSLSLWLWTGALICLFHPSQWEITHVTQACKNGMSWVNSSWCSVARTENPTSSSLLSFGPCRRILYKRHHPVELTKWCGGCRVLWSCV